MKTREVEALRAEDIIGEEVIGFPPGSILWISFRIAARRKKMDLILRENS